MSTNFEPAPAASTKKRPARKKAELKRRNLPLLMLVVRDTIASRFRPIFKQFGLTEQQYRVVRSLYERGESSIGEVASRCHILGPSLTGLINRMAKAGLVVGRLDETDMRRSFISLTRQARSMFEEMVPLIEDAYTRLEEDLGVDEVKALYRKLDQVMTKLDGETHV